MQDAMRSKRLTLAVGVCFVAVIIVVVVVRLGPPPRPVLDSALVTYNCTDVAATSLRAHADIIDDRGDWVTRRGFQYLEAESGDIPGIIPLMNPSFEYRDPPTGWTAIGAVDASHRSTDRVKVGDHSLRVQRGSDWGVVAQALEAGALAGTQVTLGGWVYVEKGSAHLSLWDGSRHQSSAEIVTTGTWIWTTVRNTFDKDADRAQVRLSPSPNSIVYFDGLLLVEGSSLQAVFEDGEFGTGTYARDISGLEPETVYVIRAFAENRAGINYGDPVTCRTPAA